jgi:hypothetical protein
MLTARQRADRSSMQEHQQWVRAGRGRPGQQTFQRRAFVGPGDHPDFGLVTRAEQLKWFVGPTRPGPDQPRRPVTVGPDRQGIVTAWSKRQ